MAVAPMVQRRLRDLPRVRFLRTWERRRGSRVIALIHRQETMSLLGFPLIRYIDIQDSEELLRALRLTAEDVPIDIILHTPGGLALAAEQIAHAICRRRAKVTVYVPHYAMSGGTLIALAADEIVMDPNAVLGSLDPQLGLPINTDMPREIYEYMRLFPQASTGRPSVQYVPLPYRSPAPTSAPAKRARSG